MSKEPTNAEIRERQDRDVGQEIDENDKNELFAGGFDWVMDLLKAYNTCHRHRGILLNRLESAAETNRIAALAVGELEGRLEATEARLGAMLSALEIPPTGMALKPQELAEICRQITVAAKCGVHTPLHGLHKLVGDEELEATLKEQVK